MAVKLFLVHCLQDKLWVFVKALGISSFDHQRFDAQRFVKRKLEGGAILQDSLHVIEVIGAHVVLLLLGQKVGQT